ncbi:MAG: hypothetical protein MSS67_04775 [Helicobacter bilis]|uniref:hypothetical protein n=1 Tax=Helicobacter bilis TaxID=37372 RepID=UPI000CF0EBB2|nr:hypothetical protein [Helicobacter bilis]MCI7411011.1 hypothetical protein [Helicobacter bilis]
MIKLKDHGKYYFGFGMQCSSPSIKSKYTCFCVRLFGKYTDRNTPPPRINTKATEFLGIKTNE